MRKGSIAALDLPIGAPSSRARLVWLLSGERRIEDPAMLAP
jgi:hypothetical protein